MNFDANWYHHLFDRRKELHMRRIAAKVSSLGMHDDYTLAFTDIEAMEAIASRCRLVTFSVGMGSSILKQLNGIQIQLDEKVWQRVSGVS